MAVEASDWFVDNDGVIWRLSCETHLFCQEEQVKTLTNYCQKDGQVWPTYKDKIIQNFTFSKQEQRNQSRPKTGFVSKSLYIFM